MTTVRKTTLKEELLGFMKNTSMKGVPRIVKSEFIILKWTWIVAVLGFLSISLYLTTLIVMDYLKYSVTTSVGEREINISNADQMELVPSVLVCNLNPFSSNTSKYQSVPTVFQYRSKVLRMLECVNCTKDEENAMNRLKLELTTARAYFQYIGIEAAKKVGHQAEDFILECHMYILDGIYKSKIPCNDRIKMDSILTPDFFNCFTFSFDMMSQKDEDIIIGISLMLHLDNFHDNKIHFFNTDNGHAGGAVAVIYEENTIPIITGDGYTVPPGFAAKMKGYMQMIRRQPSPYGNCVPREATTWSFHGKHMKYTQKSCISACLEKRVVDQCKCIDAKSLGVLVHEHGKLYPYCENLKKGLDFVKKASKCASKVRREALFACNSNCSTPCNEVIYASLTDIAKWPLVNDQLAFYKTMLRDKPFKKRYDVYESVLEKPPSKQLKGLEKHSNLIENNVLLVDAFLAENRYVFYHDNPKTLITELFSQLGGVLNLWSGITFVLFIEFLDMILRIFRHFFLKYNIIGGKKGPSKHTNGNDVLMREMRTEYSGNGVTTILAT